MRGGSNSDANSKSEYRISKQFLSANIENGAQGLSPVLNFGHSDFSDFGFRVSDLIRFASPKNFVCLRQCFFAADVEPAAFDLKRVDWLARIKPLQKPSRLVRIIAGRHIGGDQTEDLT